MWIQNNTLEIVQKLKSFWALVTKMKKLNWKQYKKNRIILLVAFISNFILVGLVSNYLKDLKFLGPLIFLSCGLLIVFPLALKFGRTPCPNCEKPIHMIGLFGYPFGPCCLHCKVKIGQKEV